MGEVTWEKLHGRSCIGEVASEKLHQKVALENLHWRSCMGEVEFGVGAESMAASQPHGVMVPTSSASIS